MQIQNTIGSRDDQILTLNNLKAKAELNLELDDQLISVKYRIKSLYYNYESFSLYMNFINMSVNTYVHASVNIFMYRNNFKKCSTTF